MELIISIIIKIIDISWASKGHLSLCKNEGFNTDIHKNLRLLCTMKPAASKRLYGR